MLFIYEFQTQSKGWGSCSLIWTCWSKMGIWGSAGHLSPYKPPSQYGSGGIFVPDVQVPIRSNHRSKNRFNKLLLKQRHDFLIYIKNIPHFLSNCNLCCPFLYDHLRISIKFKIVINDCSKIFIMFHKFSANSFDEDLRWWMEWFLFKNQWGFITPCDKLIYHWPMLRFLFMDQTDDNCIISLLCLSTCRLLQSLV